MFLVPQYRVMALNTFYVLLGIQQETADPRLAKEVKKIVDDFVDKLRRKWTGPKVRSHLNRFEEVHSTWLQQKFVVRYLDEVSKNDQPQEEEDDDEEEQDNVLPGPSVQPTVQPDDGNPQPPPAKKRKTSSLSFLEKVII